MVSNEAPAKLLLAGLLRGAQTPQLVWHDLAALPTVARVASPSIVGFSWSRLRSRFCTGRYDLRTFAATPCPLQARLPVDGPTQCEACLRASGFTPTFYLVEKTLLSQAQQAYNAEPHEVYIAAFGNGLLKVGISSSRRLLSRWIEQGALFARSVGRFSDAYEARSGEALLHRELGIPETLAQSAKTRALSNGVDAAALSKELEGIAVQAAQMLSFKYSGPEVDLWNYFVLDRLAVVDLRGMVSVEGARPLKFGGEAVALIGRLLIARYADFIICCSIRPFEGHLVLLDTAIPSITIPVTQNSFSF